MKKLIFILSAVLLSSCSSNEDVKDDFCGNVIWAEYDISTDSVNVTLDNGSESRTIKTSPPRQYSKGEYICL